MNFLAVLYNSIVNLHDRQLYRDERGRGAAPRFRINELKRRVRAAHVGAQPTGAYRDQNPLVFKEDEPKKICVLKGHLFKKDFAAKKKISCVKLRCPLFAMGTFVDSVS